MPLLSKLFRTVPSWRPTSIQPILTLILFTCGVSLASCSKDDATDLTNGNSNGIYQISDDGADVVRLSATDCEVSSIFRRAEPADLGGEHIRGIPGKYKLSSSGTLKELAFNEDYVSRYAQKIEEKLLIEVQQTFCREGKEQIALDVTILELPLFQPLDLSAVPRYGSLKFDESNNTLYGLFVWNPRQILSDQYLLHTRRYPSVEIKQISPEQFSRWTHLYHRYLQELPSREISKGLSDIPEDVFWLFELSPQVTRISFGMGARSKLESIISGSEPGYSQIAAELIDFEVKAGAKGTSPDLEDLFFPDRIRELFDIYTYELEPPQE